MVANPSISGDDVVELGAMKIVAFAASNSLQSINKKLVSYAARSLSELSVGSTVEILDLNDFQVPLFGVDLESAEGQPEAAKRFFEKLGSADVLLVSFAEHNGSYAAVYKNLFDWVSRIDRRVFQGKPVVYLAASPGPGGAQSVLRAAQGSAAHFGAELKATLSVPRFNDAFDSVSKKISDPALNEKLRSALRTLL